MKVLLVAEGKNERGKEDQDGALEILVRRLQPSIRHCDLDRVSRKDIHTHRGKGQGFFKRALRWIQQAEKQGYDALILVVDQDKRPASAQELADAQHNNLFPLPRALGVAIRTFDAWILADEQALTKALGYAVQRGPNPEAIRDAKSVCDGLLEQSKMAMSRTKLYADVAREADIGTMETRCPKGFVPFAERVRGL